MRYSEHDVLDFVRENDVKFIRLAFCDLFGIQKNISITDQELPRAFEGGISFDASAVEGFLNVDRSDLFLFPEPDTLAVLPWRPGRGRTARLFCEIRHPDGTPFEGDGRYLLRRACERARGMGYLCQIGPECEFYLFELDEKGNPSTLPIDNAGYLDVAPADRGENIRRDICLTLEEMGIVPESFHHEQGPGQNEIDFRYSDALTAADQVVTFKGAVRTMAAQNGMYASFLPKPMLDCPGSGMHVNMSLLRDGRNVFQNIPGESSEEADQFLAGILLRVREITALLNPLTYVIINLAIVAILRVGGVRVNEGAITQGLIDTTDVDFAVTAVLSIAAIFVLIAICFKSPSLPVILVLSIELAIWINLSITVIMGTEASFVDPTVVNCVQLGATVDYAILLTTRFREELRHLPRDEAMLKAVSAAQQSIFQSAGVFFAATFGVYLVCDIYIVRGMCALLARGAIISEIVIIVLLSPVLCVCESFIAKTTPSWRLKT